jgi:predicted TIM-barrel fold metal-dependent hydrolase
LPFWREDPRSPHERTRLRSGRGALVVVDHSGAVVVQGTNKQQTQRQLARFVKEQGVLLWQR